MQLVVQERADSGKWWIGLLHAPSRLDRALCPPGHPRPLMVSWLPLSLQPPVEPPSHQQPRPRLSHPASEAQSPVWGQSRALESEVQPQLASVGLGSFSQLVPRAAPGKQSFKNHPQNRFINLRKPQKQNRRSYYEVPVTYEPVPENTEPGCWQQNTVLKDWYTHR